MMKNSRFRGSPIHGFKTQFDATKELDLTIFKAFNGVS